MGDLDDLTGAKRAYRFRFRRVGVPRNDHPHLVIRVSQEAEVVRRVEPQPSLLKPALHLLDITGAPTNGAGPSVEPHRHSRVTPIVATNLLQLAKSADQLMVFIQSKEPVRVLKLSPWLHALEDALVDQPLAHPHSIDLVFRNAVDHQVSHQLIGDESLLVQYPIIRMVADSQPPQHPPHHRFELELVQQHGGVLLQRAHQQFHNAEVPPGVECARRAYQLRVSLGDVFPRTEDELVQRAWLDCIRRQQQVPLGREFDVKPINELVLMVVQATTEGLGRVVAQADLPAHDL
eukprot:CAMPEP_0167771628 /NCGR_PEP_ID=MMETSP0111_2-20121227/388_1 /TAXON_ID=91324 /ORGANISM="Lotharella globosa, Strain CCCM811" /LENGTH=290 /DNA_ID=CAMNT_0007661011 /DNA_START=631 /DNA_END=1500 /DNA_ORIENTATION=-